MVSRGAEKLRQTSTHGKGIGKGVMMLELPLDHVGSDEKLGLLDAAGDKRLHKRRGNMARTKESG